MQFQFRLAGHLKRSVEELRRTLTYSEFIHWLAYAQIQPFGEWADDYRAGQIVATLANVNRNPKKKSQPFNWWDFFPWQKPRDWLRRQLKQSLSR